MGSKARDGGIGACRWSKSGGLDFFYHLPENPEKIITVCLMHVCSRNIHVSEVAVKHFLALRLCRYCFGSYCFCIVCFGLLLGVSAVHYITLPFVSFEKLVSQPCWSVCL